MMLDSVMEGREYLTGTMGLGSRLAARVGMLLGQKIAFSRAVLEEARNFPALERLILCRELRSPEGPIAGLIAELLSREVFLALADELPLAVTDQVIGEEHWRIIALEEEVEAEAGFSSLSLPEGSTSSVALPAIRPSTTVAQCSTGGDASSGHGVEAAFSREKIAELRVTIFAGQSSAERVSALRRLAFAPMDNGERIAIFVQALAEEDGALRAAAAAALRQAGLMEDVAESIRLLAEGEVEERDYACQRLGSRVLEGGPLEVKAGFMALLGTLRSDSVVSIRAAAVKALVKVAPRTDDFTSTLPELVRLLLEQVIANQVDMSRVVRQGLKAFEDSAPGVVGEYLIDEASKTQVVTFQAYLLSIACSCRIVDEHRAAMLAAVADCLLALPAEDSACHVLGSYLVDQGDEGVRELVDRLASAGVGHQRFLVHLLDNAVRFNVYSREIKQALADAGLKLLQSGSRQLCNDLFDTRIITVPELPTQSRVAMAEALLSSVRDFGLPNIHTSVENALVRLGGDVIPTLLVMVGDRAGALEGRIACRALGRITVSGPDAGTISTGSLEGILRVLQRLTFTSEEMRNEVYVAMGQVCSTGRLAGETVDLIVQSLMNRLSGDAEDAPVLRALGWLAASPVAKSDFLSTVGGLALAHLKADVPDSAMESSFEQGEEVFVFTGSFDVHSELIPASLEAMDHLLLAPHLVDAERSRYVAELLPLWKDCARFKTHWSPGNVVRFTALLGRVASLPELAAELRSEIVHTLCFKLGDFPVLDTLGSVLATGLGGSEFDRLAAAVATRLLKYLEDDRDLTAEDRELYLQVLGRVASRGRFELRGAAEGGERLLGRVIREISRGVRDRIPGAMKVLSAMRINKRFSSDSAALIKEELSHYTTVAIRP